MKGRKLRFLNCFISQQQKQPKKLHNNHKTKIHILEPQQQKISEAQNHFNQFHKFHKEWW